MNKEYIKEMYMESLTEEKRDLIRVLSVIATEGLPIDVACNIIMPEQPRQFGDLTDSLCSWKWVWCDHRTLIIKPEVAKNILHIAPIDADLSIKSLSALQKHIALKPLDDMMAKREYFVAARLLLSYLLEHKQLFREGNHQLISLFSEAVISFSDNVELSFYGNKRQPIWNLEDRIDFKLCSFVKELDTSRQNGQVYIRLGRLYSCIFRYHEARNCFALAGTACKDDALLSLAKARMYENYGSHDKAFYHAYCAYLTNKEKQNDEANIEVCLYIAFLCGVKMAFKDCKQWRDKARALTGGTSIPQHHLINILLKEIEALLHVHEKTMAYQILDSAELEVCHLYGDRAPELTRISYIRSFICGEMGQYRNLNEEYRRYVDTNHYNYAYSKADTAVLYCGIINENLCRGNSNSATYFAAKMQGLRADDSSVAPIVRLSEALSNSMTFFANGSNQISKGFIQMAQQIYDEELNPRESMLKELLPIFHNGIIPKGVFMVEEQRVIHILTLNVCFSEHQTDKAMELIERLIMESKGLDCSKWQIQWGRLFIKDGAVDEGLDWWKSIFQNAPMAHKFELANEITAWASECGLASEVVEFYEEALQPDIMAYGKTSEIAEMLRNYAHTLVQSGSEKRPDEPWKQAIMMMNSLGDTDGIALAYYAWGTSKKGEEAEELFRKAIQYWKPERYVFDETLSKMYYQLYLAQVEQSKLAQAASSARKVISLNPGEFPPGTFSDVGL